jgi:hypothetical protein
MLNQEKILKNFKSWLCFNQNAKWKFDDKVANEYSIVTLTRKLNDAISAVL